MDWFYIFLIIAAVAVSFILLRKIFHTKEYLSDNARNILLFVVAMVYLFFIMDLHENFFDSEPQADIYEVNYKYNKWTGDERKRLYATGR